MYSTANDVTTPAFSYSSNRGTMTLRRLRPAVDEVCSQKIPTPVPHFSSFSICHSMRPRAKGLYAACDSTTKSCLSASSALTRPSPLTLVTDGFSGIMSSARTSASFTTARSLSPNVPVQAPMTATDRGAPATMPLFSPRHSLRTYSSATFSQPGLRKNFSTCCP